MVDNKYFTNFLIKSFNNPKKFNIKHKKITINTIKDLLKKEKLICHIDNNYLGDYSHASHFIIIEKSTHKKFRIIDPMEGKKKIISHEKLYESITSLKKNIKMCPLLFYLS